MPTSAGADEGMAPRVWGVQGKAPCVLELHAMTIEQVRRLYDAQPFQPFTIHLADGREVPVLHGEFIMAAPSGRTVVVCQPDDTFNIIDLLLVTDLEVKVRNGSKGKRGKR